MRFEHDDQDELPHLTWRPRTLSTRQIIRRLADLRRRLRAVKKPEVRARLLADYLGFASRDR